MTTTIRPPKLDRVINVIVTGPVFIGTGVAIALAVLIALRDHRVLRRFTYTAGLAALVFIALPLSPLGHSVYGAKIWIKLGAFTFQPAEIANGAVSLLDEVAQNKVTGEEERYSRIDLLDFASNVEGAQQAFANLQPGLAKIDPTIVATITSEFDACLAALDKYKDAGNASGFVNYDTLTQPETQVLLSLMRTGRRVRSKADLVLAVRGQEFVTSHFVNEADKKAVEGYVASLRSKIGDDESAPRYIETVRGVGFRLAS